MVGTFSATSVGTFYAILWSVHSVHSIGYPCFIMLKVRFCNWFILFGIRKKIYFDCRSSSDSYFEKQKKSTQTVMHILIPPQVFFYELLAPNSEVVALLVQGGTVLSVGLIHQLLQLLVQDTKLPKINKKLEATLPG